MTARCFSIGLLAACLAGPAASQTPEERGAYLVQTIAACGNCHSPLDDQGRPIPETDLSGRFVIDMPPFKAFAKNITPASRIKDWTDEELARAIREGIRPDGSLIGPPMPFEFYRHLSDTDVTAIVAYLRSVPAVENEVPDSDTAFRCPQPMARPWTPSPTFRGA